MLLTINNQLFCVMYNTKRVMVLILLLAKIKCFQLRNGRGGCEDLTVGGERASEVKALIARAGKLIADF